MNSMKSNMVQSKMLSKERMVWLTSVTIELTEVFILSKRTYICGSNSRVMMCSVDGNVI